MNTTVSKNLPIQKRVYHTYTGGFKMTCKKDITKAAYIKICDEMSKSLNVKVTPEAICEGGFYLHVSCGYKTMRHRMSDKSYKYINWPTINPETQEQWRVSDDILWPNKACSVTMLKAFEGAEIWTIDELMKIKSVLEQNEIKVTKMPLKRHLKSHY
jgi:hypothetical protein